MRLCKQNALIIFDEILIENQLFLAESLKQMFFNFVKKPNILLNISGKFDILVSNIKKYANVKVVKNSCIGIFSYMVHYAEFDIGLFFYEKDEKTYLNIYSGSGYPLSNHEFSFFENNFENNLNSLDYKTKKYKVYDFYDMIYNKKNRYLQKWVNKYINSLKNGFSVFNGAEFVMQNKLQQFILSKVFDAKNKQYFVYGGKNIYIYKNNDRIAVVKNFDNFITDNDFFKCTIIKNMLESESDVANINDNKFVIKNSFDFENISAICYELSCLN